MFPLIILYLSLTIVRPQDYIPALAGVPLLPIVLAMALLAWMASRYKTFSAPHFVLLPVFLLALMMSEVANGWIGGAIEQFTGFAPVVVSFVILAAGVSANQKRVSVTFAVFALCSCVLALHGVEQKHLGMGWTGMGLSEDGRIQYVGIFNDPNDLGLLFVTAVPMAVYMVGRSRFLMRMVWLTGTGLLLYGVYLTNSRGAMLALLVEGGIYIWMQRGVVVAGLLGGAGLAAMRMLSSRMDELDAGEDSAAGRVDAWYEGLHMFTSHPLFGVGAGNFTDYNYLTAHNSFILVLAETGFFGYVTWLAFVGYSFLMLRQVLRHQPSEEVLHEYEIDWPAEKTIARTLLLSLCGLFTAAFFLSRSYTVILYLTLAIVVGAYVGIRRRVPDLPPMRLGRSWWTWVPTAIGSIAFFFVLVAVLLHSE